MFRRFAGALLASVAGVISIAVLTAEQPSPSAPAAAPIRLRAATFTPVRGAAPGDFAATQAQPGRRGDYLVQFEGPVQDLWKAALAAAGAEILEYVPDFAFRVRMDPALAARVRSLAFVTWVGPYHPAYKLDPSLARNGRRAYVARLERGADAAAVQAALAAAGVAAMPRGASLLMIAADASQLDAVAQVDGIASLENFVPRVKHNEYGGGGIMGSNVANANGYDGSTQTVAVADTGLGGGTPATAHADLPASRITAMFNWPGAPDFCFESIANDGNVDVDSGHGTHVATAVLGSGNATGVGRGTAPAASLVFQSVENYAIPSLLCSLFYGLPDGYYLVGIPADLGDLFGQAYDSGARVHSDSWGSDVAGAYTTDSQNTDAFLWDHRDLAVTISAGNAGMDFDGDGVVDEMSIGAPATAKNVITVGASENDRQSHWECDTTLTYTSCATQGGQNSLFTYGSAWPDRYPVNPLRDDPSAGNAEQLAAFSSRGPTADGRIKPDVVAPGTWTLSGYSDLFQQQYDPAANPQNGVYQYDGWGFPLNRWYKYMGGTSMAAPLAGGGAAVVRDYYQKAHAHSASAALVKATLINSAADLLDENNDGVFDNANPIPNMHEGWGRVDLANATDGSHQFDDETSPLSTGGSANYAFTVPSPGLPFKATLVWTDFPSSTSAAVNLVNDLDLVVTAPDGTTYLGNVFTAGWAAAGGSADRLNNVENVYVFAAASGVWTVTVTGYNVASGPQPFALVVDTGAAGGSPLPVVRVAAADATATEAGLTTGSLRVTRSGDTSSALTVTLGAGGTATADSDYVALPGTVVIAEGQSEVLVPLTPLQDVLVESPETVVVSVLAGAAYTVGSPSSAIVTVTSDDLPPDLVVTTVTAPAYAALGSTITITDTTRNAGTTAAAASATGFYLSANSILEPTDHYIGSRPVPSLNAGVSDVASSPITVPATTPPGLYYVIATADDGNAVAETSETNNLRVSAMVRVGPDLQVTALVAPTTAAAGDSLTVTDTTKNAGVGTAAATVTAFFLSTNTTWEATDTPIGSRPVSSLPEGVSESAPATVTVPLATAVGTYYILAKADAGLAVAESMENNNVRASGALRVGADLTVTVLTAPASAGPGDTINVNETTANAGGGDAPASSTAFYLSLNSSLDAADAQIGTRAVGELEAGASSAATAVPLTIPLGTVVGTYYVIAKADWAGQVNETSETNNTRVSTAVKVGPDLTVLTLVAPAVGGAGETLTVTETVKNLGGGATTATESAFFLSVNGALDASDIEVGRRTVPALLPGVTDVLAVPLTVPPGTAPGNYYVFSSVDPDGVVAEVLETNNVKASGIVRVGPDLVVSALTGPTQAVRGTTITLNDTTRNQGGGAAEASTTSFYLSLNGTIDAGDVLLGSRAVGALGAGAQEAGPTSVLIPAGQPTGNYYVIAKTDAPGTVPEHLETNNTRVVALKINP